MQQKFLIMTAALAAIVTGACLAEETPQRAQRVGTGKAAHRKLTARRKYRNRRNG